MSREWQKKDWEKILKEMSSGEDSDEHDSLNVCSVQKNAGRVTDLLHATIPGLDPSRAKTLPMGMNRVDFIREGLVDAMIAQSRHLREYPASAESESDATERPQPETSSSAVAAQQVVTQTDSVSPSTEDREDGVLV
jgi:hypothetical protein